MPKYGNKNLKGIPASKIIESFVNLPDDKRFELLNKNLSEKSKYELGEMEFTRKLENLKKEKPEAIRAYLTDSKNFGGPWEDLIPLGEAIAGGHIDRIYSDFGVDRKNKADKLYALVMCPDLANRLRVFWDGVHGERREMYKRDQMLKINTPQSAGRYLGDQRNYAPGKSFQTFAEDVLKEVDLSSEKTIMDHINESVPENDPQREHKLHNAAQLCILTNPCDLNIQKLASDLNSPDWEKKVAPEKKLEEVAHDVVFYSDAVGHIKNAVDTIPETDEEKKIFQNAALQTCRDMKRKISEDDMKEPWAVALVDYTKELQNDIVKRDLKEKDVQDIRGSLATEFRTLEKEKSGWFLSKTNTAEYDAMMKGMRLFNAKLDLMNGVQPKDLTDDELKTVRDTEASVLFKNAKRGCYDYGCLKTKEGKSGIIHAAGEERFDSSMKSLSGLNKLGKKLHLCDPAETVRDEAQRETLQHRRDKEWLAANAEDLAAKTIYAQTLLNKGVSAAKQEVMLEDGAVKEKIQDIKSNPAFKKMVKTMGTAGIADALIKGVGSLASAFTKANAAAQAEGQLGGAQKLSAADIKPREHTSGLTVPTRK